MTDPRAKRLAGILTDYSIRIKKGDIIELSFGVEAKELALVCYKNILKKGAFPVVHVSVPGFGYTYYKLATDEQLKAFPKIAMYETKVAAGSITIGTQHNTKELTNIYPGKMAMRSRAVKPVHDLAVKKNNWVYCEYPTNALAQEAEMSLEEFEDFVYKACLKNWKEEAKKQTKLQQMLNKAELVRIVGENTDLTFSIKGRQGIKCCGTRNMPDGEVFVAPVETSTHGHIQFSYPALKSGREVDGIYLEFKKGAVVKAKATKNEKFLKEMINTDKGSRYLGEFGIGVNYDIKNFIKHILFDEKIGGTIHLALGMAYPEGGGKNKSAIHWDMIKDLRRGGKLFIDGKLIQKNGKFTFKL